MTTRRFVLLGASNLTWGFPQVTTALRCSNSGPVEILMAHGHGRSYGMASRVLHRRLPGIVRCGIWPQLESMSPARTSALLTDVGNDLLYGVGPDTILKWVGQCLERLARGSDPSPELILTRLPVASILRMSSLRYHATRFCFFPGGGPDWKSMRRMVEELDGGLAELGNRHGAQVVTPPSDWYGLDPIHIRRAVRPSAWQHILSHWPEAVSTRVSKLPLREEIELWRLRPERRWLAGRLQRTPQPVSGIEDGAPLYLF